jgi:alcohol dehydrogenase (cytochrome c)
MQKSVAAILLGLMPMLCLAQTRQSGPELFADFCSHCHGGAGQGGELGPSILGRVLEESDESLIAFLKTGNPEKGMPPVTLDAQQLPVLLEHLDTLAANAGAGSLALAGRIGGSSSISVIADYEPVTDAMLANPSPDDWLWFNRTADAQRFSPLDQINRTNVGQLTLVWSRNLPAGITESTPNVYQGLRFITLPGGNVAAFDATTGDQIWTTEFAYRGNTGGSGRSKNLSLYADMVYFTAPDSTLVALDARTGAVRWQVETDNRSHIGGSIVVNGKVISSGGCANAGRDSCYISAHEALTGEQLWKFYTTEAPDPVTGEDSWNGTPLQDREASPWGLPGSFDPESGLVYWGIANPMPNTRANRHGGDPGGTGYSAPADLYSNSTVALDPETGELVWYYQHLPGDDWDMDINEERTIFNTALNPDPDHVRWINPAITPGERRDVVVNIGEGGGLWVLDRHTGEFLWATPFPVDVDNIIIEDIDVNTGRTTINRDLVLREPGDHHVICFFNTRGYWSTSYNPEKNMLYVPYIKNCLNMTSAVPATATSPAIPESRIGVPLEGTPLEELNGLARVNMETGEITLWPSGAIPTNSALLSTAGDVVFPRPAATARCSRL